MHFLQHFFQLSLFIPSFCNVWVSDPRSASMYYAALCHICQLCMYYKNYTILYAVSCTNELLFVQARPAKQLAQTCVAFCHKRLESHAVK
jgi:hypothetical protein